jgi:hypothetical protein
VNADNHRNFKAHIDRLIELALTCRDEDRRADAARSLYCMALLRTGPESPDYPGEMLPLVESAVEMVQPSPSGHRN